MTYKTTARRLIDAYRAAKKGFQIPTGMWNHPKWTPEEFFRWFRKCLDEKISIKGMAGREAASWRKLEENYQLDLRRDARMVNEYHRDRIRHTGCKNILRLPEMQKRYPYVNTQPWEA